MKTKIILFFTLLIGLSILVGCTENSKVFSFSFGLICTMIGVFLGQCIKKKIQFPKRVLWRLGGMFLLALALSISIQMFSGNNEYRITYIVTTNLILAIGGISYLVYLKQ